MKLEEILGKEEAQKAALLALSPLDGRYSGIAEELRDYFSEYALIKYRVKVEIAWLDYLLTHVSDPAIVNQSHIYIRYKEQIKSIAEAFNLNDALRVKEIEGKTKHDVKAVEYFIAEKIKKLADGLERPELKTLISLVHIGCTSEDINNVAYALMIKDARKEVYIPALNNLIELVGNLAIDFNMLPMLARTHGQPAIPTTLGKEYEVYRYRLSYIAAQLDDFDIAKFNGATGNYSAISVAFPNENWMKKNQEFIESLGLKFNPVTTQIESHDGVCQMLDLIKHINRIILNLDVDKWMYISNEYFKQLVVKDEVGSSTMPQKVNPIKFENSEGNCYISNGLIEGITQKLLRTRWQRDLSDSTVQRNIGMAMGYSLQAIKETLAGLKRCSVNVEKIAADLDQNWSVLAEPIQTMLRKYGDPDAYDKLKAATRGKKMTKEDIHAFVNDLTQLSDEDRSKLLNLTPSTYIGLAANIVEEEYY